MNKNKKTTIDHEELVKVYRKALLAGLPLDKIEEKVNKLAQRIQITGNVENEDDIKRLDSLKKKPPKILRVGATFLPLVFLGLGLFLIGSATLPIMSYYVNTLPSIKAKQLATPIPQDQVLDVTPLIIAQAQTLEGDVYGTEIEDDGPIIIDAKLDYTNLSNWFGDTSLPELENDLIAPEVETEYSIEIPKLNIENAVVKVGGTDLNNNLIHYSGTALPGQPGSPVIFGHSILRQFYNPKESNPRRYKSIFSTIMTLKKGDEIFVTVGNVKYTYVVQEKTEVQPTDVYILNQRYDDRQLKLVTCVPEGTYLRRGVVTAQLVKN